MNPRATILIPASKQKIPMKYGSVFSCRCRAEVLVRGGPCQSDAGRGTPGRPVHSDLSSPTGHQDFCPCMGGERGGWRTRGEHRARKAQGTGLQRWTGAGSLPGPHCFPGSWPTVLALPRRRWLFHAGLRAHQMPQRSHPSGNSAGTAYPHI